MEDIKYSFDYTKISYDENKGRLSVKDGQTFRVIISHDGEEKDLKDVRDKTKVRQIIQNIHSLLNDTKIEFDTLDGLTIDSKGLISDKAKMSDWDSDLLDNVTKTASSIFFEVVKPKPPSEKKVKTKIEEEGSEDGIDVLDNTVEFKKITENPFKDNETPIIKKTLGKAEVPTSPMKYYQATISDKSFDELLKAEGGPIGVIETDDGFYDYTDVHGTYVDFANYIFGSAFLTSEAQEEIMVLENPDLAFLIEEKKAYGRTIKTADSKYKKPSPVLVEKVTRKHKIEKNSPPIDLDPTSTNNIVGMAARPAKSKEKYTKENLKYHLKTAYLAFALSKQKDEVTRIHTGQWGCGVFGNNVNMMVAIQILAAHMAGVPITFHATEIEAAKSYITARLKTETIDAILDDLVKKSNEDSKWQAKK